ncbi:MAG: hypothetical protein IIC93_04690 [Chloroflexi bacterium]|nr:hypothetical protein [Chloroflexota bacterium]
MIMAMMAANTIAVINVTPELLLRVILGIYMAPKPMLYSTHYGGMDKLIQILGRGKTETACSVRIALTVS